ncbi:MAG: hypothetical protein FJ202_08385 [Gemmatimonadetes bacterium]|nr:hypothetical protein [Gemmatimonadota bacterium]
MSAVPRVFMRVLSLASCAGLAVACSGGGPTSPVKAPSPTPTTPTTPGPSTPAPSADPPVAVREFRGIWVATVANIDFPTAAGLPVATQRAELRALLDRAQAIGMNAVILQVRAAGDALYTSSIEPSMKSLAGQQGSDPGWDPLSEAVTEAHARGLELHAWFNPFRAGNPSDSLALAPSHLFRARRDLGRVAQGQLWFDPGEPEVQDHVMRVIQDVLARYDVDGVHLDDYFYPYPTSGAAIPIQFPDDASYAKYLQAGGVAMDRADWRRQNVNRFVERLYRDVKATKPLVKVGLSPFGIWRPGTPAGIVGLDAWRDIFADSRLWLEQGWVDYFAPQLYWSIASSGQSFPSLFNWWLSVNARQRHVWPGLAAYRVADGTSSAFTAREITQQIDLIRAGAGAQAGGARGALFYNTTTIRNNRGNLADSLTARFAGPSLVPTTPWLDAVAPATPSLTVTTQPTLVRATWASGAGESPSWWLLRWRVRAGWRHRVLWGTERSADLSGADASDRPDVVMVAALDRAMNLSADVRWNAASGVATGQLARSP